MNKKLIESTLNADNTNISIYTTDTGQDYISLTDIAKHKNSNNAFIVISNWMRNHSTISFLGLWEQIHNPNFKPIEFDRFKARSGENSFTLTPQQWIKATDAIGIVSKSGRYGGTYAHADIAFEFASWISPEFKLYIIEDYQRLKQDESYKLSYDWNVKRLISKANYRIHTDAIKINLIPPELPKEKHGYIYADEAEMLNKALFGITSRQWRNENPTLKGNIRDYATIEQLLVLANLENANALFIKQNIQQNERLHLLNKLAIEQLKTLSTNKSINTLKDMDDKPKLKM